LHAFHSLAGIGMPEWIALLPLGKISQIKKSKKRNFGATPGRISKEK
jgi:hypothetical protein